MSRQFTWPDSTTLVNRAYSVGLIVDTLRSDAAWGSADDTERTAMARRLGFARWAVAQGVLGETGGDDDAQA